MRYPKNNKHLIVCLFLWIPFFGISQYDLTIEVTEVPSSDGYIGVGIYNSDGAFLKEGKTFSGAFETAKKGKTIITILDLPKDTYAVSLFHDENGNKALDTNFIGIPKEAVAFSKAKMKMFGPPDFEACSFQLDADTQITIPLD